MDRFIRRQNVERCCRLLERVTEESDRQTITPKSDKSKKTLTILLGSCQ